jgi:hypothetical protein
MNRIFENAVDVVGVFIQGLPTHIADSAGTFSTLEQGEDFVEAAVRTLLGIVERGPYQEKASMVKKVTAHGEELVQGMIDSGNLVLVVVQEGDVSIYSKHQRNKLPKIARQLEGSHWRIFGDFATSWCSRMDGNPVATTVGVVLNGDNPVVDKSEQVPKELGPRAKADLRNKFWGQGGASPKGEPGKWDQAHAEEIVNKLLQ